MERPQYLSSFDNTIPLNADDRNTLSEKDEQDIWDRFIQGNDHSLIYVYRNYADQLYRYGRQFTKRSEFLRDCIQELFYELIDRRARLSKVQSIKGYLFASLKRKIIRNLKKEDRLQFEQEGFHFSLSDDSLQISSDLDERDFSIIEDKLNELPVNQREVILLYFYEGLSYQEIAEIMGIKVRSARALTYRALSSMQKKLAPYKASLLAVFFCFKVI